MRKTYHIEAVCERCGKTAKIIGYEKLLPAEVLANFIEKGGCCSNCQTINFKIVG